MKKSTFISVRKRGQTIVLFLVALVGIIGFSALAIEGSAIFSTRRSAQNAVDAAALAGAYAKCQSQNPVPSALNLAQSNGFINDGDTNVEVHNPPTSGPNAGDDEYIEVIITTTADTSIVQLFYSGAIQTTARSVARCSSGGAYDASLIVLNGTANKALNKTGSGSITVQDGNIHVNSIKSNAVNLTGSSKIYADEINIVGDYNVTGTAEIAATNPPPNHAPNTGASPITDPLASVNPPPKPGGSCINGKYSGSGNVTFDPGLYCYIKLSGSGSVTFNPGIYWIEGDFKSSGSGPITANGVMFYINNGEFDVSGSSALIFSAPTSGDYQGLMMYMDRSNGSDVTITGSTGSNMTGTFYAASSPVVYTGSSSTAIDKGQYICDTFKSTGSSNQTIIYDSSLLYQAGNQNVTLAE